MSPGSPPVPPASGGTDGAATGFRRSRLAARCALAVSLGFALFLAGFAVFLMSLDRNESRPSETADGIVALTGGAGRIEDAVDLLASGFGGRLLITGVNERTSREAIKRLSPGQRDLVECCIDLGYRARDTSGNASEIGQWVRERGFRSLIVVTSYYHLPRALAELDEVLPDVRKIPHAVVASRPLDPSGATLARARVLVSEYMKYVIVSVRLRVAGWLGASARGAAAQRTASSPDDLARVAAAG